MIAFFNHFYAYYMYVFYACMVIVMFFTVGRWRYFRRRFFISMAFATPWCVIYPLAPPRFMQDYGYSFVDTLKVWGPNYFSENGLVGANRYAAMPSMHVAWTTLGAIALASCLPWRRVGYCVAALLIVTITITVIVPANQTTTGWMRSPAGS